MELFFVILVILLILAAADLVVGVSNDAVNFLNSAIGSKAAPRWIILTVASAGILLGTTFSTGMMEVARQGIFHPETFLLQDIMYIFLAVMITDVLLLDLFNTFGLPTSTTVSLVFELLGGAVAMAMIKISNSTETLLDLSKYINSEKALFIISGILISIVVSFSVGSVVQFITRLIFTFDYEKRIKRYGAIWGAIALAFITYFILIKGAKHSSFMTDEIKDWLKANTWSLLLYSSLVWGIIIQLLISFTRVNILKIIILIGTFALALAFAANDLVNFIGVPLAGLASYQLGVNSENPLELAMSALKEPVSTNTYLLILAGIIMSLTLFFSKKANTVTRTEINLSRQGEGFERFDSSILARKLVRGTLSFNRGIEKVIPQTLRTAIRSRFENSQVNTTTSKGDSTSFDLIRASVNLLVSSVLISFATSLKLPLSTTYVTFMVAMGSSFSDKAWGRESAVYRITGVIAVVGGWFFTAVSAFTGAALVAFILYIGGIYSVVLLTILMLYIMIKTHIFHRKKEADEEIIAEVKINKNELDALVSSMEKSKNLVNSIKETVNLSIISLGEENISELGNLKKDIKHQKKLLNQNNSSIIDLIKLQGSDNVKQERRYGKLIASLQMLQKNSDNVWHACFNHIDNNHQAPDLELIDDLKEIVTKLNSRMDSAIILLSNLKNEDCEVFETETKNFEDVLKSFDKKQIMRMKETTGSTRNNFLFLDLFSFLENISNHLNQMVMLYCKNYKHLK